LPFQLQPRTVLNDQYLVGRALGAGGFAITYLAWDQRLARRVAIKEYMPSGLASRSGQNSQVIAHTGQSKQDFQYGLERFLDEARIVARFQEHPGIISVTNYFPANGTAYLVMEYLEGSTLKEYLAQQGGRLSFDQALAIMTPVMDALRELHRADVLHRDISPDNIYITHSGQVKLLDFGAARQALRDRSQRLSVILKVGYAPEEQYRSSGDQGPWTDLYAVAATFYHLITGQIPPPSIDRLAEDSIQLPSALGSDIPAGAEEALMTALAVKSAQRYPTIQDFQAAIGLPSSGTVPRRVRRATLRDRLPLPSWAADAARNPWVIRGALIGGLGLICLVGFMAVRMHQLKKSGGLSALTPGFHPELVPHFGEIAPAKDSWPPNDLDTIAAKALARARKWAPDAQLVELAVELNTYAMPMYDIQTNAGTMKITMTFYSPSKQQAVEIEPNAPTNAGPDGDLIQLGFSDMANSRLPIPGRFLGLPEAIKKAQQEGMRSPTVSNATLTNNLGSDSPGLKWFLRPVFSEDPHTIDAKVAEGGSNG
jgi:serine/threonine protein kinase